MKLKMFASELKMYICNNITNKIPSHTYRLWYYRKLMRFKIGKDASIHMSCIFDCSNNFTMGDHSVINPKCRLDNRGHIYIGSNVSISQDVLILTASHDLNNTKIFKGKKNPVKIMDYVFIGTRAIILPGVIINEGGVVGAGSIVTKDVSPYTVVAGNPARPIGTRIKGLTYNASYRRLFQ